MSDIDTNWAVSESWTGDMLERMKWLRAHEPVFWSEKSQLWIVSKFEDVVAISKNPALFCSGQGILPGITVRQGLIDEDAPRHTQLRRLISGGFTPRMVAKLEGAFREITREALDAVAPRGACDFVRDIAVPLPLLLIAEMIGIEREDRLDFHRWSDAMMAGQGNFDDPEIMAKAGAAFVEYSSYVSRIIEDRRRSPRDDLVSILTGAKDAGLLEAFDVAATHGNTEPEQIELANDELIMLLVTLMVAGNETTRNALSGAMELLIEHPDARQELIDDPSLIPDAVEELLRLVSPVRSFARTATEDTELRGRPIAKGQKVLMVYPSANRDEEVFEAPDELRIRRKPHHLAFGIGAHFCLGANLARMELRVALGELLRRFPDMGFDGEGPEIVPHSLVRACVRMPVRFRAEAAAG
ncbi:MAG: cytochrome P450 [Myxococcota bacterium]|nr:cytochrome P450 [Myxococcota bacterium]